MVVALIIVWTMTSVHKAVGLVNDQLLGYSQYSDYAPSLIDSLGNTPVSWGEALRIADSTGAAFLLWGSPVIGIYVVIGITVLSVLVVQHSLRGARKQASAQPVQEFVSK